MNITGFCPVAIATFSTMLLLFVLLFHIILVVLDFHIFAVWVCVFVIFKPFLSTEMEKIILICWLQLLACFLSPLNEQVMAKPVDLMLASILSALSKLAFLFSCFFLVSQSTFWHFSPWHLREPLCVLMYSF